MLQKSFFQFVLGVTLLSVSGVFTSCSNEDDPSNVEQGETSPIVGKWEVSNENAEYGSFEFTNDKKYIITQKVSSPPMRASGSRKSNVLRAANGDPVYIIIIFGDYSTLAGSDDKTINLDLSDFGTITITLGNGTVNIVVNGESYEVTKTEEMSSNDKTDLLCHTWTFSKYEIIESLVPDDDDNGDIIDYIQEYGKNWKSKWEEYYSAFLKGATVTFSKAGTYFSYAPNGDDNEGYVRNMKWEWSNISKGIIKYEIEWWSEILQEDGSYLTDSGIYSGYITVELTSKTLKYQEGYEVFTLTRQ